MRKFKNPYRKLQEAWRVTEDGIKLLYPIFHHDPTIPHDPIIKRTVEDVIGDIDFWGWEGSKDDRIVDSSGKVFIAKFKKTTFGMSMEWNSGVLPGEVERIMTIEEVKEIIISGMESHEIRIKEDVNELKKKVNSIESIQKLLKISAKYF